MNATTIAFVSGWCGGIIGCICSFPLDTVKTLMQHQPASYTSIVGTSRHVYRKNGIRGFYHGAAAPIALVGAITSALFVAYYTIHQIAVTLLSLNTTPTTSAAQEEVVLPLWAVCVCGAATGAAASCIQGPAELVKIRQQTATSAGKDHRLLHVLRALYHDGGGLRAFTKGLSATLYRDVPATLLWFGSYEAVRRGCAPAVAEGEVAPPPSAGVSLLAGGVAGFVSYAVVQPLDVIKTTLQADPQKGQRYLTVVRDIALRQGLRGFYRGVGPSLCRSVVANATVFAGRDGCAKYLKSWQ